MPTTIKSFFVSTLLLMFLTLNSLSSTAYISSESARFTLLTCTPGPDLYSLFGHSAIRYQDTIRGKMVDWVYNYGTFIFDEDFYVKFARGKLDYVLSKQDFPFFQEEYIYSGRGIFEQELLFTSKEKQKLLDLLEENYLPQNRTYRYDFFYDNCSTRIRDIIIHATSGLESTSSMGFTHPDADEIKRISRIDFSFVYPQSNTFRQTIQSYLDYQPWSDFGIDLALGFPCDKEVGKGEYMFLPDSLMKDFNYAHYDGRALAAQAIEILPQEFELTMDTILTPMLAMALFFILHLVVGILCRRKKRIQISDRFLFFITGLLGVFVVFLWFFTDHTATKWNFNLLWANPLNLYMAFGPARTWSGWKMKWMKIYFFILLSTLGFWFVLPQRLNMAVIPIIFALLFSVLKIIRPRFLFRVNDDKSVAQVSV